MGYYNSQSEVRVFPSNTNYLMFVTETRYVFFEVGTELLNITFLYVRASRDYKRTELSSPVFAK